MTPITLYGQLALKAALHMTIKKKRLSKVALAKRLQIDEKEARRLLDPHHRSLQPRLEKALISLGSQPIIKIKNL